MQYPVELYSDKMEGLYYISARRRLFSKDGAVSNVWVTRAYDNRTKLFQIRVNPYGFTNTQCDVIDMFDRYVELLIKRRGMNESNL
jgi:hypothetical protein